MDGLEVLRQLADRRYPGVVVLISGVDPRVLAAAHELAEARLLSVLDTLVKPVSTALLDKLLAGLVTPASIQVESIDQEIVIEGGWELDGLVQLCYQPCLAVNSRRVDGAEVLAHLRGAGSATDRPSTFIDLGQVRNVGGPDDLPPGPRCTRWSANGPPGNRPAGT